MKLDPILTKATRLLRRRNYDRAIKLLEPEVNRYRGIFTYYYILALSYLHTGVFNLAFTYFKLARDIKMRDPLVLLGLAVLYLRRGETDRAVDFYLEVQDQDDKNKIANKALKVIRKYSGTENLSAWIETGGLAKLFPPPPLVPPSKAGILMVCGGLLIGLVLSGGLFIKIKGIAVPVPAFSFFPSFSSRGERDGLITSALDATEREEPVQVGGSYRYILTRTQVFAAYEDARKFFTKYQDEAAKVALNRILESNASDAIKTKSRLLMSYMEVPGFDTLKDRFTYKEVYQEPVLYRDCHVIWRGMATNLEVLQNATSFNLLVGYDTRSTLEGIVAVNFDFAVSLNPEQPLEVLGRIIPVSTEKGQDIALQGVALHQAGLRLGRGK
ncbi:MAG: tetratricopeptide repeat protein [Treponema sp.]|jgi:tetratricopeptide (TPR) repeat protein|nr:tetratricopeptide repeat protein [Treponema sp.]